MNSHATLPALRETNKLVVLPDNYSVLVKKAAVFQCAKRVVEEAYGEDAQATMLCLICGALLCTNSYCCQLEVEGRNDKDDVKKIRIGGLTQHVQKYNLCY